MSAAPPACAICGETIQAPGPDGIPLRTEGRGPDWVHWPCSDAWRTRYIAPLAQPTDAGKVGGRAGAENTEPALANSLRNAGHGCA